MPPLKDVHVTIRELNVLMSQSKPITQSTPKNNNYNSIKNNDLSSKDFYKIHVNSNQYYPHNDASNSLNKKENFSPRNLNS